MKFLTETDLNNWESIDFSFVAVSVDFGRFEKEARKHRKVKCTHLRCCNMQCETKKFKQNIAKEEAPVGQMVLS